MVLNIIGIIYHHSDKNPKNPFLNKTYKDENYHLDKSKICLENGVKLIHIFEHEYLNLNLKDYISLFEKHDISFNGNIKEYVNTKNLNISNIDDEYSVLISKPCITFI